MPVTSPIAHVTAHTCAATSHVVTATVPIATVKVYTKAATAHPQIFEPTAAAHEKMPKPFFSVELNSLGCSICSFFMVIIVLLAVLKIKIAIGCYSVRNMLQ